MEIKVKYFSDILPIEKKKHGDWIDLRLASDVEANAGEYIELPLGVAMELPEGYEAVIVPRSSTFKKYGILLANSQGVIDHTYCGDSDEWHFPAYCTRHVFLFKNDRICQFRIQKNMEQVDLVTVDHLDNPDRGGLGSTGIR